MSDLKVRAHSGMRGRKRQIEGGEGERESETENKFYLSVLQINKPDVGCVEVGHVVTAVCCFLPLSGGGLEDVLAVTALGSHCAFITDPYIYYISPALCGPDLHTNIYHISPALWGPYLHTNISTPIFTTFHIPFGTLKYPIVSEKHKAGTSQMQLWNSVHSRMCSEYSKASEWHVLKQPIQ